MRPALACLFLLSCTRGGDAPAEIAFDRDTCAACTMVISQRAYATEVKPPEGPPKKFDDLGCALGWLERQPFATDPKTRIWVTGPGGAWADARTARFVSGQTTPMGYGVAPGEGASSVDFEAARALLKARPKAP